MHEELDCELSEWHLCCHKERDIRPRDFSGNSSHTTTKIIYDVTIYGVAFKIMTSLNLKFIKVTHHIKNLQLG